MRSKATLVNGFLAILIMSLLPMTAFSAQKITPGSICKVKNEKIVYQNKVFTCVKSGKKLTWSKGEVIKKAPAPTPTPIKAIDEVQKVIDAIRTTALSQEVTIESTFKFNFQDPTSADIEDKTKRSLQKAVPVFAKMGFPITDGLIFVSKDDAWLRDEFIKNDCEVDFTFPQAMGFYIGKTCTSGNGAVTVQHWDVMKLRRGIDLTYRGELDGLYFNHALPHEYFHQIQSSMVKSKNPGFPKWLTEGSAQFFTIQAWVSWNPQKSYVDWHTHWWTELNTYVSPRVCSDVTIFEMSDPSTPDPKGTCAYSKGQLIVEYLIYKYGLDKFRDLYSLNNSKDWRDFNLVFKAVTGDELNDFYTEAERFMVSRGW